MIDKKRIASYEYDRLKKLADILKSPEIRAFLADRREYLVDKLIANGGDENRWRINEIDDWMKKELDCVEKELDAKLRK